MQVEDWLVVGGGPVGTLALAVLLSDARISNVRFAWVDPNFKQMGRLGRYGSVPANTRTDRLLSVFRSLPALDFDAAQARRRAAPNVTRVLSDGEPLGTEPLQASIDALKDGSDAIRRHRRVYALSGAVTALRGKPGSSWEATISGAVTRVIQAQRVLLATGAAPRLPPPALLSAIATRYGEFRRKFKLLGFDDAVTPHRLLELVVRQPSLRNARFAIIGASHSGMLAARNVVEYANATAVHIYSRGGVRLADERDGWIKYDGTGLKGDVRAWAVEVLRVNGSRASCDGAQQGHTQPPAVPGAVPGAVLGAVPGAVPGAELGGGDGRPPRSVVVVHSDAPRTGDVDGDATELAHRLMAIDDGVGVDWLMYATGFERRRDGGGHGGSVALPEVSWSDAPLDLAAASYDGQNGRIAGAQGLHGIGIGFPEVYTDPEGYTEQRVGYVNSLVAHVQRIVGEHAATAGDTS